MLERPEAALAAEIGSFVLVEREARALACAQLRELGASEDGTFSRIGEVRSRHAVSCLLQLLLLHQLRGALARHASMRPLRVAPAPRPYAP